MTKEERERESKKEGRGDEVKKNKIGPKKCII